MQHVLSRLRGVVPHGHGYLALCPLHRDFTPSLAVDPGAGGRILVKCRAGCDTRSVLREVGLDYADIDVGSTDARPGSPSRPVLTPESAELRHRAYSGLLAACPLSPRDRKSLLRRGLSRDWVEGAGYGTLSFLAGHKAARRLAEELGEGLFSVPGFIREGAKVRLASGDGLLVPCRGPDGKIQGVQVRTGVKGRKYQWLSHRDASVGSPIHCPAAFRDTSVVRVTEGPLKADVATALDGRYTLGVAGACNWGGLVPLLNGMPRPPSKVQLAFDMDRETNEGVAYQMAQMEEALVRAGYETEVLAWDSGHKGIDDWLLASGHRGAEGTLIAPSLLGHSPRPDRQALAAKLAELERQAEEIKSQLRDIS